MIRYFYLVSFITDNLESFDLGVFSFKKLADKKIEITKLKKGFSDYPIECFKIIKFGVQIEEKSIKKENVELFCISHEYEDSNGDIIWNIFDYFSSIDKAQEKVKYLKTHNRIGKKYPLNFEVNKILVNNYNSWSEGFDKY